MSSATGRSSGETADPPRRADAQRNVDAIMAAGLDLLARTPTASMAQVAAAAGVGRVTLYAHFPNRNELLKALVHRALGETSQAIDAALTAQGSADQVLASLVSTSWRILDQHRRLRQAALAALGTDWVRNQHDQVYAPLASLIERGRAAGRFRTDLPVSWMIATCYGLLHAAAEEVDAGALSPEQAPQAVVSTLLSALRDHSQGKDPHE